MELDTENMTISEYLEYKAAKERRLWDDVRSRRSPTKYNEADVDSFHRNKSKTFSYPYSHNLTPPYPCFLPVQPYPKNYLVSTNERNDVDIENMTIVEYNLYVAKQGPGRNPLNETVTTIDSQEPLPQTTPPNDDYVAPATKSILEELLEEFGDKILNIATINKEADPTKDLEELERLLAMRPQSNFTKIQIGTLHLLEVRIYRNHKKTVKNEQARTQESEEYKKKPKNQSRSQKSQALVKFSQR
ncbi:hypothetical protein Tco_1066253 [Tanacetum coccineum]|uniref:Uncharacterized protein n=1 Tax=Tanacetum coccineum TaxID=301880 RepID=A0ABQ5HAV6_9ASTR